MIQLHHAYRNRIIASSAPTGGGVAIRILTASDVDALLTPAECLAAVRDAFRRRGKGDVGPPGLLGVHVAEGAFHIKAAAMDVEGRSYFAAKTNGNFPSNPQLHGLPSIQGVIALADAETGTPLAVLDSVRVTELRTAAATAVAAECLAREEANTLTLIGCGAQAASQVRALHLVRPLERVFLVDRMPNRAESFARSVATEMESQVEVAKSLEAALAESDLCVTCTTSRAPFLAHRMIRPGTFIAAVGADSPEKNEVEPALLAASKVVVDSMEQCASIGDLRHALEAEVMERGDVHAELGEVVAGLRPGREHPEEIIVFDSTGLAFQDVAAVVVCYERAEDANIGLIVDLAPNRGGSLTPRPPGTPTA